MTTAYGAGTTFYVQKAFSANCPLQAEINIDDIGVNPPEDVFVGLTPHFRLFARANLNVLFDDFTYHITSESDNVTVGETTLYDRLFGFLSTGEDAGNANTPPGPKTSGNFSVTTALNGYDDVNLDNWERLWILAAGHCISAGKDHDGVGVATNNVQAILANYQYATATAEPQNTLLADLARAMGTPFGLNDTSVIPKVTEHYWAALAMFLQSARGSAPSTSSFNGNVSASPQNIRLFENDTLAFYIKFQTGEHVTVIAIHLVHSENMLIQP